MSQAEIRVNGREYRVTCDNGQEERLQRLAGFFDRQVTELANELGQIGDARLMLLAALTICDELFDARKRMEELASAANEVGPDTEGAASRAIAAAVTRVNDIADRLSQAQ